MRGGVRGIANGSRCSKWWVPPLSPCCSEYKSPEYETLSYNMIVRRLVAVGYPKVSDTECWFMCTDLQLLTSECAGRPHQDIEAIAYDVDFPVRLVDHLPSPHMPHAGTSVLHPPLAPPTSCRGLLFDKSYGNLIKVDGFGNILEVFHGFTCLSV